MTFCMYVDESGNSGLKVVKDPRYRYLSLTGVVFEQDYLRQYAAPALDDLKQRFFGASELQHVCLHRKELIACSPPFQVLEDPIVRNRFNFELLGLLDRLDFKVITVIIDKIEYFNRYRSDRLEPYHLCLSNLVERYVMYLQECDATGDVISEARGKSEDRRLKTEFTRLFDEGTERLSSGILQRHLSSRQLKLRTKADVVAGLEIADLLAHPSHVYLINRYEGTSSPENFGARIARILITDKFLRSVSGKVAEYGMKWLP